MATPVFAPYAVTYSSTTPYITAAEFNAGGTGVDSNSIVPGGTAAANSDALNQIIAQASSMADTICHQVLAATLDTQSGQYRIQGGMLHIPTSFSPIISVNDIQLGVSPDSVTPLTSLQGVWIRETVIDVPVPRSIGAPLPGFRKDRIFAVVQYVNGFANAITTDLSGVNSTWIDVDQALGVVPGMQLTLSDPGQTETITVATVNENRITASAPLAYQHTVGVSVSALPPAVKRAVILLTAALIKTRGVDAIVMPQLGGQPSQITNLNSGGAQGLTAQAEALLHQFAREI